MLELSRTVRFCLNGADDRLDTPRHNGYSGWPAMRGLGRYYQLDVRCRGEADAVTGYFINITHIDAAVRSRVLPYLVSLLGDERGTAETALGAVMRRMLVLLQPPLNQTIERLRFDLTPFYCLEIRSDDMDHVTVRQQFDFSAAHRLHVESLSPDENRRVFGKCNNPSGHGHNYRLEVAVRAPIDAEGRVLDVETLDRLVDRVVIEKLDHKHLNLDVPEFRTLNPSVENIAKVIHGLLLEPVRQLGVELDEVSVWETTKTVCTYRGAGTPAVL